MQKLYRTVKLDGVKAKSAGEYFGTLQESVTDLWREHLKTTKYSAHMALDEYYTEMPEKVDGFIEAYIAVSGSKIMDYTCNLKAKNLTPLEYLKLLKEFLEDGREEYCGEHSELNSCLDDCLELIDATIYKLRELHEGLMDLRDFINESLQNVNEAAKTNPFKCNPKLFEELLKVLGANAAGNYSQISGLEEEIAGSNGFDNFDEAWDYVFNDPEGWLTYADSVKDWLGSATDKNYSDKELAFKELIRLLSECYDGYLYDYRDDGYEIDKLKKKAKPEDFGVEAENCYGFYEFTGKPIDKKLARIISQYADCTR